MTTMSTNEDGIRTRQCREICMKKITDIDVDTWGTKLASVFLDNRLALWTYLEGVDLQMRELQTCFDRDAACAEADVPKDVLFA